MSQFGHIDLRVSDIAAALNFYDQLLPHLGFTERYQGEDWKVWATTESLPSTAYFAITEERDHIPNSNRAANAPGKNRTCARGLGSRFRR